MNGSILVFLIAVTVAYAAVPYKRKNTDCSIDAVVHIHIYGFFTNARVIIDQAIDLEQKGRSKGKTNNSIIKKNKKSTYHNLF